jgi:hypothetical protein
VSMVVMPTGRSACDEIEKGGTRDTRRQSPDSWSNGDRLFNGLKARHVQCAANVGDENGFTDSYATLPQSFVSNVITRSVPTVSIDSEITIC